MRLCNATSNFDKCLYIRCLRAEFGAKHTKTPLSLTTHWKMEPDFGPWQSPNISRSHLYHVTIAWTPPSAIYWEYTVLWSRLLYKMDLFDLFWSSTEDCISLMSAGQGCCLSQNILLLNMMILIWKSCCMLCFMRLRKLLIVEIPGGWCRFLQSFRDQLDVAK